MKLKPYGSNMTLIRMNNGTEILFSYSTPVAGYYRGEATNAVLDHEYFKTVTIEQEEIDSMMSH